MEKTHDYIHEYRWFYWKISMSRSWFNKGGKVTADTARRITGISTPFGGIQWATPGPTDREVIRGFILFLEDRRVLYNPMLLEVRGQVDRSIHEIRQESTNVLRQLGESAFAVVPIRQIREACRRFHDESNLEFRSFHSSVVTVRWGETVNLDAGFFTALGAFRATVGQQVAILAAHYDIDIEGDLANVLPQPSDQT